MKFVTDPASTVKIQKMQERVRWRSSSILERQIDQTQLAIADDRSEDTEFSFLVIGDSGAGGHRGHHPQRRIAEQMVQQQEDARFILHTGDVMYLVGSSEFYPPNFIEPYREFIVGGEQHDNIAFDQMVFKLPFLPVLGNHDYYDLPLAYGTLLQMTYPLRRLFRSQLQLNLGWHGSYQGKAFAQAFIDPLWMQEMKGSLEQHLDQHYTSKTPTGRCLTYEPGRFTRIPNRYYSFRYGGIDFFALDSNTFNEPTPLPANQEGEQYRQVLQERRKGVEAEMQQLLAEVATLNASTQEQADRIDDIRARLQQLEEVQMDIEKQLTANAESVTDFVQLEWLRDRLVESWGDPTVRGRIVFFHHPPYVTEATKWHQAQTLVVRQRLRYVFDEVAGVVGDLGGRGVVDLVLNGHAHCLEYLRTVETGHADSNINWIVCGGSGYSLRRQRVEGTEILEKTRGFEDRIVAKSQMFVGREGEGSFKRRPYSFVRIDVRSGEDREAVEALRGRCHSPLRGPLLVVRPYVSEWFMGAWEDRALTPFVLPLGSPLG